MKFNKILKFISIFIVLFYFLRISNILETFDEKEHNELGINKFC
jgi:hypothetical protein